MHVATVWHDVMHDLGRVGALATIGPDAFADRVSGDVCFALCPPLAIIATGSGRRALGVMLCFALGGMALLACAHGASGNTIAAWAKTVCFHGHRLRSSEGKRGQVTLDAMTCPEYCDLPD